MENRKKRTSPELIFLDKLQHNEVFVFGSNEAGVHAAGAAKQAVDHKIALFGKGFGPHYTIVDKKMIGSFAIPTKDWTINSLSAFKISLYIERFIAYASTVNNTFLVTEIGCGLARFTPEQIAPLFKDAVRINNIHLPKRFWDILEP